MGKSGIAIKWAIVGVEAKKHDSTKEPADVSQLPAPDVVASRRCQGQEGLVLYLGLQHISDAKARG